MVRCSYTRLTTVGLLCSMFCYILYIGSIIHESKKYEQLLERKITIWSNDFHISPINDVKQQLAPFNVRFIDKSLSSHCYVTNTCGNDLKVLNRLNGLSPSLEIRKQFYEVYKNDSEINQVDVFICFHPAGMCELFMPFNRTLIIIASTRYELGRHTKEQWTNLNKNLQIIASNPRNVIAGNNLYDAEYIRYFTGIKATVIPSLCGYTNVSYMPKPEKPFLIAPTHNKGFSRRFTSMLNDSIRRLQASISFGHLREIYRDRYKYSELVEHPGIIYIPYQVSVMSLFEQYRMNIPLFFPSLDLLTEWHYTHYVIDERTWDGVFRNRKNASVIPGVLESDIPDPNNEFDRNAIRYWIKFSDFYQWPYITYYNSTDELVLKLKTVNLKQISENMKRHNVKLKRNLYDQWGHILQRIIHP